MTLLCVLPLSWFCCAPRGGVATRAAVCTGKNCAANLWMISRNPQNLYLFSFYNIRSRVPSSCAALPVIRTADFGVLVLCSQRSWTFRRPFSEIDRRQAVEYILLFCLAAVSMVLRVVPYGERR